MEDPWQLPTVHAAALARIIFTLQFLVQSTKSPQTQGVLALRSGNETVSSMPASVSSAANEMTSSERTEKLMCLPRSARTKAVNDAQADEKRQQHCLDRRIAFASRRDVLQQVYHVAMAGCAQ